MMLVMIEASTVTNPDLAPILESDWPGGSTGGTYMVSPCIGNLLHQRYVMTPTPPPALPTSQHPTPKRVKKQAHPKPW